MSDMTEDEQKQYIKYLEELKKDLDLMEQETNRAMTLNLMVGVACVCYIAAIIIAFALEMK